MKSVPQRVGGGPPLGGGRTCAAPVELDMYKYTRQKGAHSSSVGISSRPQCSSDIPLSHAARAEAPGATPERCARADSQSAPNPKKRNCRTWRALFNVTAGRLGRAGGVGRGARRQRPRLFTNAAVPPGTRRCQTKPTANGGHRPSLPFTTWVRNRPERRTARSLHTAPLAGSRQSRSAAGIPPSSTLQTAPLSQGQGTSRTGASLRSRPQH